MSVVREVEPSVYGRSRPLPACEAYNQEGWACSRYGRFERAGRLVCRQHWGADRITMQPKYLDQRADSHEPSIGPSGQVVYPSRLSIR